MQKHADSTNENFILDKKVMNQLEEIQKSRAARIENDDDEAKQEFITSLANEIIRFQRQILDKDIASFKERLRNIIKDAWYKNPTAIFSFYQTSQYANAVYKIAKQIILPTENESQEEEILSVLMPNALTMPGATHKFEDLEELDTIKFDELKNYILFITDSGKAKTDDNNNVSNNLVGTYLIDPNSVLSHWKRAKEPQDAFGNLPLNKDDIIDKMKQKFPHDETIKNIVKNASSEEVVMLKESTIKLLKDYAMQISAKGLNSELHEADKDFDMTIVSFALLKIELDKLKVNDKAEWDKLASCRLTDGFHEGAGESTRNRTFEHLIQKALDYDCLSGVKNTVARFLYEQIDLSDTYKIGLAGKYAAALPKELTKLPWVKGNKIKVEAEGYHNKMSSSLNLSSSSLFSSSNSSSSSRSNNNNSTPKRTASNRSSRFLNKSYNSDRKWMSESLHETNILTAAMRLIELLKPYAKLGLFASKGARDCDNTIKLIRQALENYNSNIKSVNSQQEIDQMNFYHLHKIIDVATSLRSRVSQSESSKTKYPKNLDKNLETYLVDILKLERTTDLDNQLTRSQNDLLLRSSGILLEDEEFCKTWNVSGKIADYPVWDEFINIVEAEIITGDYEKILTWIDNNLNIHLEENITSVKVNLTDSQEDIYNNGLKKLENNDPQAAIWTSKNVAKVLLVFIEPFITDVIKRMDIEEKLARPLANKLEDFHGSVSKGAIIANSKMFKASAFMGDYDIGISKSLSQQASSKANNETATNNGVIFSSPSFRK